ncbi:MAG: lysophospholipid acyltransferase family protein [Chthoniobacterales bacterium]
MINREQCLGWLGATVAKVLLATTRLRVEDRSGLTRESPGFPLIITFWHNQILAITKAHGRHYPADRRGVSVLTSPSKDGEILAQIMARFQMGAIRGSSSRRGSRALLECNRWLTSGADLAVTPDGPKGPRYRLGPGVILMAQMTDAQILPVVAKFSRFYEIKSWDGFRIPFPFSRIDVTLLPYETIPATNDSEAFEAQRLRIENLLQNESD